METSELLYIRFSGTTSLTGDTEEGQNRIRKIGTRKNTCVVLHQVFSEGLSDR